MHNVEVRVNDSETVCNDKMGNGDCACIEEMNISISSDLNIYKVEKIECYSVM